MQKFYFGLSTTFHDPGIALVNSDGDILFAESAERSLTRKRAYGLAALCESRVLTNKVANNSRTCFGFGSNHSASRRSSLKCSSDRFGRTMANAYREPIQAFTLY
jgi:predicted NodU family carbamoyl transferase